MTRFLYSAVALALISASIPARAANRPHAGAEGKRPAVWTNDDLEKLHVPGLICIIGPTNEETPRPAEVPAAYAETIDPAWYAEQAAKLRDELERRSARLDQYRQALEDARSLTAMSGGINLDGGDIGTTPEDGIEILRQRVSETEAKIDALEELARHNDIAPGVLRGE